MGDSLIRIGTEVDGDPALACPHMAQWWPVFTRLVKDRFGVSLEILQAAGSYSKSGATHVEGTSVDWRTWRFTPAVVNGIVALAREMGARATWYRTKAQGFDPHVHMASTAPAAPGPTTRPQLSTPATTASGRAAEAARTPTPHHPRDATTRPVSRGPPSSSGRHPASPSQPPTSPRRTNSWHSARKLSSRSPTPPWG